MLRLATIFVIADAVMLIPENPAVCGFAQGAY